ncbi:hypothetical protein EVAR_97663_1 [Eumeta japonica]|uniref:Uncharacterized protein n=1 Tax=Eumeta variegata TaxID=151549 RepID=A0A4C1WYK0_EUMVA|nr:hypothetical protein EVAR_97663_1 [Eumeta japonica]
MRKSDCGDFREEPDDAAADASALRRPLPHSSHNHNTSIIAIKMFSESRNDSLQLPELNKLLFSRDGVGLSYRSEENVRSVYETLYTPIAVSRHGRADVAHECDSIIMGAVHPSIGIVGVDYSFHRRMSDVSSLGMLATAVESGCTQLLRRGVLELAPRCFRSILPDRFDFSLRHRHDTSLHYRVRVSDLGSNLLLIRTAFFRRVDESIPSTSSNGFLRKNWETFKNGRSRSELNRRNPQRYMIGYMVDGTLLINMKDVEVNSNACGYYGSKLI